MLWFGILRPDCPLETRNAISSPVSCALRKLGVVGFGFVFRLPADSLAKQAHGEAGSPEVQAALCIQRQNLKERIKDRKEGKKEGRKEGRLEGTKDRNT